MTSLPLDHNFIVCTPLPFFGNCPSSFVFSPKIQNYFSLQFEQKITIEDIVYQTTIVKYKSYFRVYSRHKGHGCDFQGIYSEKRTSCLLATLKQISFLTISKENIFFQNSGNQIGCDIRIQQRSRIGPDTSFKKQDCQDSLILDNLKPFQVIII